MLKSITMRNVATYDNVGVTFDDLNKVNLIYGPNGTGKTTISNYLKHYSKNRIAGEAIPPQFSGCQKVRVMRLLLMLQDLPCLGSRRNHNRVRPS